MTKNQDVVKLKLVKLKLVEQMLVEQTLVEQTLVCRTNVGRKNVGRTKSCIGQFRLFCFSSVKLASRNQILHMSKICQIKNNANKNLFNYETK
jgi:hypothetical protein